MASFNILALVKVALTMVYTRSSGRFSWVMTAVPISRVRYPPGGWAKFRIAASTSPSTNPSVVDWKLMLRILGVMPSTAVTFLATISLVLIGGPKLTFLPERSFIVLIGELSRQKTTVSLAWMGNKER